MTDQMEMYSTTVVLPFTTYLEKQMGSQLTLNLKEKKKPFSLHLPAIFICNFVEKTQETNMQLPHGG